MKFKLLTIMLSALVLPLSGTLHADMEEPVIMIRAERFKYTPDVIELPSGQAVKLHITSADVLHGFSIPQLNIRADLQPGKTTVVAIPALSEGEYRIVCDIFCGTNHSSMSGKLRVK